MSPVPEPASVALRRLDREATAGPWTYDGIAFLFGPEGQMVADDGSNAGTIEMRGIGACLPLDRNAALITTLRNALPALADLVEAAEAIDGGTCNWQPMHEKGKHPGCPPCVAHRALDALRERLGAKP